MLNTKNTLALIIIFLSGCSTDGNQNSSQTDQTAQASSVDTNSSQSALVSSSSSMDSEVTSSDSSETETEEERVGYPCFFDKDMEQISEPLDLTLVDENQALSPSIAIEEYNGTVKVTGQIEEDVGMQYLEHSIDYGDGYETFGNIGWHTYTKSGTYLIRYSVFNGINRYSLQRQVEVTVDPFTENRAPLALFLFSSSEGAHIQDKSFDLEAQELTHQWLIENEDCGRWLKTGDGSFYVEVENEEEDPYTLIYLKVTHSVSDGVLGDTQTTAQGVNEFLVADPTPSMNPTYVTTDDGVFVSVRYSEDFTGFHWEFDDGTTSSDAEYFHAIDQPGEHTFTLFGSSFIGSSVDELSITIGE